MSYPAYNLLMENCKDGKKGRFKQNKIVDFRKTLERPVISLKSFSVPAEAKTPFTGFVLHK